MIGYLISLPSLKNTHLAHSIVITFKIQVSTQLEARILRSLKINWVQSTKNWSWVRSRLILIFLKKSWRTFLKRRNTFLIGLIFRRKSREKGLNYLPKSNNRWQKSWDISWTNRTKNEENRAKWLRIRHLLLKRIIFPDIFPFDESCGCKAGFTYDHKYLIMILIWRKQRKKSIIEAAGTIPTLTGKNLFPLNLFNVLSLSLQTTWPNISQQNRFKGPEKS